MCLNQLLFPLSPRPDPFPPWNKLVINFCELLDWTTIFPTSFRAIAQWTRDFPEIYYLSQKFLTYTNRFTQISQKQTETDQRFSPSWNDTRKKTCVSTRFFCKKKGEGRKSGEICSIPAAARLCRRRAAAPRFQHNSISRFILQARCYLVRPPEFPRRPRIIRHLPSYNNGTEGLASTPPPPPPALAAMPEHWYWLIFPTVM